MGPGLLQVYTGIEATSHLAAEGLALRAVSRGLKVLYIIPASHATDNYIELMTKAGITCRPQSNEDKDSLLIDIKDAMDSPDRFEVVIFQDLCALLKDEEKLKSVISWRHKNVELVITCGEAPAWLTGMADLVTEHQAVR